MYFDEHLPDCVPEFFRAMHEEQEYYEDRLLREQGHYLVNREKPQAAIASGLPILNFGGYDQCRDCPYADNDTQTSADNDTQTSADDDFDTVICNNPACQYHQRKAGGGA